MFLYARVSGRETRGPHGESRKGNNMNGFAAAFGLLGLAAMHRARHHRHHCHNRGFDGYGPFDRGFGGWDDRGRDDRGRDDRGRDDRGRDDRGWDDRGWDGPFGRGRGRSGGKRLLYGIFARLDATPAQERAIIAEIEKLQDRLHGARSKLHDTRGDLAAAVRGTVLDDAALGAVMGRVDDASGEMRAAAIEALRNIHGVLDERRRGALADILEHGGWWWRRPRRG